MGRWIGLPLLILAAALQVTFVPQFRVQGGEPDLVMLLTIAYARRSRLDQALTWAFIGGITTDLLSASPTGTHALSLLILVFLIDRVRTQLASLGFIPTTLFVAVGALMQFSFSYLANALTGYGLPPLNVITYILVPSVAYNLVLFWPVNWFVRRITPAPASF